MTIKPGQLVTLSSIAILALTCDRSVFAEEHEGSGGALEEIVVTAAKREQSLQDVSLAVSALSGENLKAIGAEVLEDYYGFVPSVIAPHNSFGERAGQNIVIRGVSNTRKAGSDAGSLSATTGFYINDVPVTPVDTQLYDVNRVEVLRGPQGTLYGAASMGGAIKLYTNRADTSNFEGSVEGTASVLTSGGTGGGLNGLLNVPIIDGVLGARFVASYRYVPGYLDTVLLPLSNTVPNTSVLLSAPFPEVQTGRTDAFKSDTNSSESKGFSASVTFTPNDRLSIYADAIYQDSVTDDQSQYTTAYAPLERVREVRMLEPRSSKMALTSMNIAYDFDAVTLHSDTSFYTREYDEVLDFAQITYDSYGGGLDYIPALAPLEANFGIDTFTQEFRLQSNYANSGNEFLSRLSWIAGAFYMDEARTIAQAWTAPGWEVAAPNNPLPLPGDLVLTDFFDSDDDNKALFVDASYDITDQLTVSAGIRYFEQSNAQERSGIGSISSADPDDNSKPGLLVRGNDESGSTPRFNISYRLNDDLMTYGSISEGFRLGGSVAPINFDVDPECESVINDNNLQAFAEGNYESDTVRTYEVGVKSAFAENRANLNASVYRTDWTDLQTQVLLTNFPGSNCANIITANIGEAQIDGAELEFTALPSENLTLSASLSYTDARIVNPGGAGITVFQEGDRLINTPEWAGSLILDYSVPVNVMGGGVFFARGDLRYLGERAAVAGEPSDSRFVLDEFTLVGLRTGITLDDKGITVTLFANNLFDETVELNAARRFGASDDIIITSGMPRSVGLTVRKDF